MIDILIDKLCKMKYFANMKEQARHSDTSIAEQDRLETGHLHEQLRLALGTVQRSVDSYLAEGGIYFLLWGLLIPVATVLSYVLGAAGMPWAVGIVWLIAGSGGGFAGSILSRRRNPEGIGTLGARLYTAIWLSLGSALLVLVIAGLLPFVLQGAGLNQTPGITLQEALFVVTVLMGMSFMISGTFASLWYMRLLSILWWGAGLGVLLVPAFWAPAVVAATTAILNIIPGLVLSRRYKAKQSASA